MGSLVIKVILFLCLKLPQFSLFCVQQNNQGKPPDVDQSTVVINSIIEAGINVGKESVVSHCHLQVQLH